MKIKRFINSPVTSNTYVVYDEFDKDCIIIDPGSKEPKNVYDFIKNNHLSPTYIILTHSHFDHVWGVNWLTERLDTKVICSENCMKRLKVPQNYFNLLYYNDPSNFSVSNIDIILNNDENNYSMNNMCFIQTPGHTDCSISVLIDNKLFTGDTLIYGTKPVLKKQYNASLEVFINSLKTIFELPNTTVIYPGHGEVFSIKKGYEWCSYLYPDIFKK